MMVADNVVSDNLGHGMHPDILSDYVLIEGNLVEDNTGVAGQRARPRDLFRTGRANLEGRDAGRGIRTDRPPELGAGGWSRDRAPLLGTYTHIHPTNFADVPGIETHYVVLPHRVDVVTPPDLPEEQHSEYLWLRPGELSPVGAIHSNTAVYLDELADGT